MLWYVKGGAAVTDNKYRETVTTAPSWVTCSTRRMRRGISRRRFRGKRIECWWLRDWRSKWPHGGQPDCGWIAQCRFDGAGSASISGVPNGPGNPGSLNNSVNDPSGAGNANKVPSATTPGTNSLGTANSAGSNSGAGGSVSSGSQTTGSALNRPSGQSGGRIDGTMSRGPDLPGDEEIRAEDRRVDKKIKSICKGC